MDEYKVSDFQNIQKIVCLQMFYLSDTQWASNDSKLYE